MIQFEVDEIERRYAELMGDTELFLAREQMALRLMLWLAIAGCIVAAVIACMGWQNA